eukprot:m.63267 g.63267  ORF g.63267 m.63267 type:complete len:502 (-) comp13438_c0_seq1:306-1811(-)
MKATPIRKGRRSSIQRRPQPIVSHLWFSPVICAFALVVVFTAVSGVGFLGVHAVEDVDRKAYSVHDKFADHTSAAIDFDSRGDTDAALRSFRAAVRFTPSSASYSNLGVCLMRRNELEDAWKVLQKAHELDPSNVLASENIREIEQLMQAQSIKIPKPSSVKSKTENPHADQFHRSSTRISENEGSPPRLQTSTPKTMPVTLSTVPAHQVHLLSELDAPPVQLRSTIAGSISSPPSDAPNQQVILDDRQSVLRFLASDDFRSAYFERFPLLVKTEGAFQNVLTLPEVLDGPACMYLGNKNEPPFRNVKYLNGTFAPLDRHGFQDSKLMRKALQEGYTLQFYAIQNWMPKVASMCIELSERAMQLPVNVNLYITPPGRTVSLIPHTDYQCSLMVQLVGQKRWRLWVKEELGFPVRSYQIRGRDSGDELSLDQLGQPYMDVILNPGDILYVPRGCVHATSTFRKHRAFDAHDCWHGSSLGHWHLQYMGKCAWLRTWPSSCFGC